MSVRIASTEWYETVRFADDVTLIHEPWIKPFYRCNIWHVRGRDRDLLFDSGLGHFSLKKHVELVRERDVIAVASHTHYDHIGCHHEFPNRAVHRAEAEILSNPTNAATLADRGATDEMFYCLPEDWVTEEYSIKAAPAERLLEDGETIDLGDRAFRVVHTPGHSPGGIGLYEKSTGTFLSGDIVYDGPLVDGAYHSDICTYVDTLERLRSLSVSVVHGGHFPSFGPTRFQQLIDEYVEGKREGGCHLSQ